jgi:hypothetical protein
MKEKRWMILCVICLGIIGLSFSCKRVSRVDYPYKPVPFTAVQITDEFWQPRIETNRKVTIPYAFKQCEETGRVANFEIAGNIKEGKFCSKYPFDDSDVYKIIEGASTSLRIHQDSELEKYLDELIAKIAAAQEDDGYLYTMRTIDPEHLPVDWAGKERWSNLYMSHELYNVGHLYEAAAAHFQATGKRTLLNVALKNAELIDSVFGPGKKHAAPGHQEIEIGLVKLYRLTGKKKYLDLAKFFLDERGRPENRKLYGEYSQDHKPVIEQAEAVGHAVRAAYMYSGMADVAALTGDASYVQAIDRIWDNVVSRKMYLTGGIGAAGNIEGFGPDYELPNAIAYCETCASIANILWNWRMFLLHGEGKYIDVLERVLYNGFLSGIALSGDLFFYSNPLESFGQHKRSAWFACACCPGNITRFIPSIPGYVYATQDDALFVNLFVESSASLELKGQEVNIKQQTRYPWEGEVKIFVEPKKAKEFSVRLRVPGWSQNQPVPSDLYRYSDAQQEKVALKVDGEQIPLNVEQGYALLRRAWKPGDVIDINFPMPVRRVLSHPAVKDNAGRVALERGPLVYCAEWPDNSGFVSNLVLKDDVGLTVERRDDLLNGVNVIKGQVLALFEGKGGQAKKKSQGFIAIPYYAWAHRGQGEMAVWLAAEETKAKSK